MGVFQGFNEAQVGGKGVYFLDGLYQVEIQEVLVKTSRKKDLLYIVECKILKSTNAGRNPGMECSQVINLKHDAAMGNVKRFLAAAFGIDPENPEAITAAGVNEELAEYSYSKSQPVKGRMVDLEAVTVPTREGGKFTVHNWSPYGTKWPATGQAVG
jgi:hypothetical protein